MRWHRGWRSAVTTDQFLWVLARVAGLASYASLAIALVSGIALRTAVLDWLGSNRGVRVVLSPRRAQRNGLQRSGGIRDHVGQCRGAAHPGSGEAARRPPAGLNADPFRGPTLLPPDPTPNRRTWVRVNQKKIGGGTLPVNAPGIGAARPPPSAGAPSPAGEAAARPRAGCRSPCVLGASAPSPDPAGRSAIAKPAGTRAAPLAGTPAAAASSAATDWRVSAPLQAGSRPARSQPPCASARAGSVPRSECRRAKARSGRR